MALSKDARNERRRLVEQMLQADHTRSNRSIARACGCSHELVRLVRRELETAGNLTPQLTSPAASRQTANGNLTRTQAGEPSAALQHGVHSELTMGPLRESHQQSIRARWPFLTRTDGPDDPRVRLAADLAARIDLSMRFTDARGILSHRGKGTVYPVVIEGDKWQARLNALVTAFEAEASRHGTDGDTTDLDAYVAALEEGDDNG